MKPSADASQITLRVVLPASSDRRIMGDSDRLQQIVGNLISNAIKFTPEGGTVTVRLTSDAHCEILVVEDDGRGIEPAFLPHVFEPFRQQDSTASRGCGGLGLGLSIARQLVLLHGGTIQATSDGAGKGAKFIVSLPVSLGSRLAAEKPKLAELSGPPAPSLLSCLKLLVIEDDDHTRLALTLALEQCGAAITAASSAPEGRDLLDRFSPDAILCDIAMPGEDGYSFIRWLRERERGQFHRIPTLALTAHNSAQDRQKSLTSGFDLHVSKPVKMGELAQAVLFAVKHKRRLDAGARSTRQSGRRTAAAG
jgi:CheY-like chemotaxis protein